MIKYTCRCTQQHNMLTNLKWSWYVQVASFHILRLSIELGIFLRILTIRTSSRFPLGNWFVLLNGEGIGIRRQVNAILDFECVSLVGEGGVEDLIAFLVQAITLRSGTSTLYKV